jgi:hypothetical protein
VFQPEYVTETQALQAATSQSGQWKTILTLAGTSYKDTQNFQVPTNYWRILVTIQLQGEGTGMGFVVSINQEGSSSSYVSEMSLTQPGTETSYVHAGPGTFWFSIQAANVNWTIEVQIPQ